MEASMNIDPVNLILLLALAWFLWKIVRIKVVP
jgi:hypothetical protein